MHLQATDQRLPIGLCIFGIAYSAGSTGNWAQRTDGKPVGPLDFLNLAVRLGLSSVEAPPTYFAPSGQKEDLIAFRSQAAEQGLGIVVDGPRIDPDAFRPCLEQAAWLGTKVVRCVLSGILCGDRRPMGGLAGWQRHLDQMVQHLKGIAPLAEDLGLKIGIENHQDATSADLIRVCEEVGSPNIGITLDTGNPLAVAEDPVIFAERILPYLVHVHLKDYRMAATPSGYRLFHCPIGAGVVDFAALFRLFRTKPEVAAHIEMAALGERHIRILEEAYWAGLGDRPISDVLPVLRLMRNAETDVEWRTPWETGDEAILPTWEMQRLEESVARMGDVLATL
ncbi:MAG: sugar phosphate isomerase/epimerase family protein [Caldilineaceae bacterium]